MLKGKTKSGFAYEVDPKNLHSMKSVRLLTELEKNESNRAVLNLADIILGSEQAEAFADHCDENATEEKYADELFGEGIAEMLEEAGKDPGTKN